MKKLIKLTNIVLLIALCGCTVKADAEQVAAAIANISSDSKGNVLIELIDGRQFSLGNLKGEKGDKGDPGRDGKDGTNGINGKDGTNGINGSDGKDGTLSTDYVKDIYLSDNNQLNAKYGDDSTKTIKRFKTEGDYKFTIKYNLINNKFPELSTCYVGDTLYFDENDEIAIPLDTYLLRDKRYYDVHYGQQLSDNFIVGDFNPNTLSLAILGTMPKKNVEVTIDYICNTYILESIGYYLDNDGNKQILFNETSRGYEGDNAAYFLPYAEYEDNRGFDSITLFKSDDYQPYSISDSDVLLEFEYYPFYCNYSPPIFNCMYEIEYASTIEYYCIKNTLEDTKDAIAEYFKDFTNVVIDQAYYVNDNDWETLPHGGERELSITIDGTSLKHDYSQNNTSYRNPGCYNKSLPIKVFIDID